MKSKWLLEQKAFGEKEPQISSQLFNQDKWFSNISGRNQYYPIKNLPHLNIRSSGKSKIIHLEVKTK